MIMQLHIINPSYLMGLQQPPLMHYLKDAAAFNAIMWAGFPRVYATHTTSWCRFLLFVSSTQSYVGIVHSSRILPRCHKNNNVTILTIHKAPGQI